MRDDDFPQTAADTRKHPVKDSKAGGGFTRRDLLTSGAAGLAIGGLAGTGLGSGLMMGLREQTGPPRAGGRIRLQGGVVLSLDPAVGDFEQADVIIEGRKIVASMRARARRITFSPSDLERR